MSTSMPGNEDILDEIEVFEAMNIINTAKSQARASLNFSSQFYRGMTNQMRLLPDFLIIGGQRCGTSSLYYYLTEHPSIVAASTKETHFFDENFVKGLGWYRAQFPTLLQKNCVENVLKRGFITGEGTPYYILYPHAPRRVAEILPSAKILALLRNPVDRAYSQHWIELRGGFETLPFEDAMKSEEERLAGEFQKMLEDESYYSYSYRHHSYLTRGRYIEQLERWLDYFPKSQILVLRSEDLYSNPTAVLKQTFEFLGLPSGDLNKEYKNYRRPDKKGYKNKIKTPKMDVAMRNYLVDYFKPYNARLYEWLGRDLGWDQ
jgi:hypothetical protein